VTDGPARATSAEHRAEAERDDAGDTAGVLARRIEAYRFPEGYRRTFLAALEAFSEKGFHGTSTRDIAARAGLSPAALYAFFSSKEDVLYRIASSALDLTAEVVCAEAGQDERPAARLRAVVRMLSAWVAYHSRAVRIVVYQVDALTPDHQAEIASKKRAIGQVIKNIIVDGVSAGEFDVTDIPGTATAIISLCLDVARWYHPGGHRTPEAIAELNAQVALRIATRGLQSCGSWRRGLCLLQVSGPERASR
jgi:AcrR family transcriptional regulator